MYLCSMERLTNVRKDDNWKIEEVHPPKWWNGYRVAPRTTDSESESFTNHSWQAALKLSGSASDEENIVAYIGYNALTSKAWCHLVKENLDDGLSEAWRSYGFEERVEQQAAALLLASGNDEDSSSWSLRARVYPAGKPTESPSQKRPNSSNQPEISSHRKWKLVLNKTRNSA